MNIEGSVVAITAVALNESGGRKGSPVGPSQTAEQVGRPWCGRCVIRAPKSIPIRWPAFW